MSAIADITDITPITPVTPVTAIPETCLHFECEGAPLVGILSQPRQPARPSPVGLVIVVGGPQYRVGSHRQFVLLARTVAAAGHAVLRFDYRGMGDGGGEPRDFTAVNADIAAAMAALRGAVPAVQAVALWGLCDGASAALLFEDAQPATALAGLCLLNPWVRSAQSQATAQVKHYYTQRLRQPAFWVKLLRGQVGLGRLTELAGSLRTMLAGRSANPPATAGRSPASLSFQQRMARAWQASSCPLLLVLSGQDLTAKEFVETLAGDPAWQGALARPRLTRLDLPDADHTCSSPPAQRAVEQATVEWMAHMVGHQRASEASLAARRVASAHGR